MRVEVMEYYGLAQPIDQAGYYETAHHKQLIKDIKGAIREGRLIAVCGVVGSGKTVTLRRLQQQLRDENKIIVAKSLSVEKHSIKLATLISALFYDLTQDKLVQIPEQGERRERELQELVRKGKRTVALFVDEAHDLNGHTLTGLKRLMAVAAYQWFWQGIPNYVTTCVGPPWKKSATGQIFSRWTGSPAANGNTFSGC